MYIFWDYTKKCNLTCTHCYNAPDRKVAPSDLTTRKRCDLVKQLASQYPGCTLHFLGGEPLVSKDIRLVTKIALDSGCKLEITTNGTFNSTDTVDFIRRSFRAVHLSIDGHNAEINDPIRGIGSYNEAMTFARNWNNSKEKTNAKLDISFCVTLLSSSYTGEIIKWALSAGFDAITFQPIKLLGNAYKTHSIFDLTAVEYFDFGEEIAWHSVGEPLKVRLTGGSARYKEYIKWKYFNDIVTVDRNCGSGLRQLRISSDGRIMPCHAAYGIPDFLSDTRLKSSLPEVLELPEFQERSLKNRKAAEEATLSLCGDCEKRLAKECFSGCALLGAYGPSLLCKELAYRETKPIKAVKEAIVCE